MLFLVLDFPLGAPNTLLKHVIEGSIWGIGWGGILVGLGVQSWWLGFWSCWNLSLTAVFGLTFRLLVLREYSYLGVYLSAVTIWSMPFVIRPSKNKNVFLVRVFEKNENEGLFIFYFLFFKMAAIWNFRQPLCFHYHMNFEE